MIKIYFINLNYLFLEFLLEIMGIGDWGLGPIPNPQSPIPNPQSPIILLYYIIIFNLIKK